MAASGVYGPGPSRALGTDGSGPNPLPRQGDTALQRIAQASPESASQLPLAPGALRAAPPVALQPPLAPGALLGGEQGPPAPQAAAPAALPVPPQGTPPAGLQGANPAPVTPAQTPASPPAPQGQVPGALAPAPAAPPSPGAPPEAIGGQAQEPSLEGSGPQAVVLAPPPARRGQGGGMISLNFDDADVFSVVQTVFGDILRVNYVVDARIKGRVTFRSVAPISTDQVLPIMEVILRLNGIGVVEDNGLYRVVPLAEVSREPSPVSFGRDASKIPITGKSIIQVVPVVYLQSTEVVKLITPFLSANAVVLDVPKSNQLIIVDTDASVRRVLQLIDTFDNEKQKKKRATVYVYHAQNGKAKDIANLLNQIFLGTRPGLSPTTGLGGTTSMAGARPGTPGVTGPTGAMGATSMPGQSSVLPSPSMAQPMVGQAQAAGTELLVSPLTRIYSDDGINSIIVLSTPEDYETIKETIAKIDILPRQVVIEAVIAQITLTGDLSLGLAYSMNTLNLFGLSGTMNLEGSVLQGQQTTLPSQSGNGFTFIGTDDKGIVRAYVNALAKNSKAKLLAAPHILVTDNREARIQVGSQVPIISAETYGSTTVAPQRTVQYKDIGIILKVKPQINASGLVAMEMSQEVSTFRTIALFANEQQIVIDKTEASSNLVVQDSQTIIIGGLIREDRSRSGNGIPFLMDIPILGYLFGNWTAGSTRTELIILLTPHVMKDQREARAITKEYVDNITNLDTGKGGLTRNELMKGGVQIKGGLSQPSGPETPEDPYVFVPMPGRFPGSQDIPGGPMKPQPGPMIRP